METDWLGRMTAALAYIEQHLTGELSLAEAARLAYCSPYDFQRVFAALTGFSLTEYVRRRRMSLAAAELQSNGSVRILELALKYGYESPTAFTRAFAGVHGIPPAEARNPGVTLKAFPPLAFQFALKGGTAIDYHIEERPAFVLYGIEAVFDGAQATPNEHGTAFWREQLQNGGMKRLLFSAGGMGAAQAVSGYRDVSAETGRDTCYPYLIGVLETPFSDTRGFTRVEVPASTWAVLAGTPAPPSGVSAQINELGNRLYSEWLPSSGYDLVGGFDLEIFTWQFGLCTQEYRIRVQPRS